MKEEHHWANSDHNSWFNTPVCTFTSTQNINEQRAIKVGPSGENILKTDLQPAYPSILQPLRKREKREIEMKEQA